MQEAPRVALLERLAAPPGTFTAGDPSAVMRSVVLNLRRLLNSREGSAGAQLDLGLPSPHEMLQNWPASRDAALAAIRRCVQLYEPRLVDVVVRALPFTPGDTALSFQVAARLCGLQRTPISLTTAVTADGRVTLG